MLTRSRQTCIAGLAKAEQSGESHEVLTSGRMLAAFFVFFTASIGVLTGVSPEAFKAIAVVGGQIGVRSTHAVVATNRMQKH